MQRDRQVVEFIKEGIVSVISRKCSPELVRKIDGYGYVWNQEASPPQRPEDPTKEAWWQHWWNRLRKWLSQ